MLIYGVLMSGVKMFVPTNDVNDSFKWGPFWRNCLWFFAKLCEKQCHVKIWCQMHYRGTSTLFLVNRLKMSCPCGETCFLNKEKWSFC